MRRQAAGMLGMGTRHWQDLESERQHRSDRSIEAKLPDRPLDSDFHTVAALTTISFVSSRIAARGVDAIRRGRSSAQSKICVSISSRTDPTRNTSLQFGRQGPVEIIGNVGDSEQVLPKPDRASAGEEILIAKAG